MGEDYETVGSEAAHRDLLGSSMSRRTLLQSIPAIVLAAAPSATGLASADSTGASTVKKRSLRIDQKFVLFPINNESLSRRVRLVKNGHVLRSFTGSLGLPAQWWAHLDVSEWLEQTLTLSIETDNTPPPIAAMAITGRGASETDNAELVASVRTSPEIWSPATLYKEPLRPAFHFTPRRGWSNDPNGLMYHAGQYHLFFQHNPYGVRPGNTHWGHAVSTDLVHWKEMPIALYPHGENDFAYSGSGVVDQNNTSGWGKNGRPPMVIAFTSTGRGECMAYSQDDGTTWQEFEGNPVVKHKHKGRDPKLLWHRETKQWVMAVYSEQPGAGPAAPKRGFAFYTSGDLKSWQERSWIEGYYECPDLFALPIDGDPQRMKWVLSGAPGYYHIGEFDGSRFIPESPRLPAPAGGVSNAKEFVGIPLFYAAQTFSSHPEGHRVQIGWGRVATVDAPFTQLMSFPTTLGLRTTSEGVRLCREPVDTIRSLRARTYDFPAGPLTPSPLLTGLKGEAWDIEAVIRIGTVLPIWMNLGGDEYVYHPPSQLLSGPKGAIPIPLNDGRLQLRVLVDKTTVEIFGDLGQAYGMFVRGNPGGNAPLALRTLGLMADGTYVERLSAHSLQSAWLVSRASTEATGS